MAEVAHTAKPPEEYEVTEVDGKYVAGCPFCSYLSEPEDKKESARVRVALHILEEQSGETT